MEPLYYCERCRAPVAVRVLGPGVEPEIRRRCGHDDAMVIAPRKVTVSGAGGLGPWQALFLRARQALSALSGRSV